MFDVLIVFFVSIDFVHKHKTMSWDFRPGMDFQWFPLILRCYLQFDLPTVVPYVNRFCTRRQNHVTRTIPDQTHCGWTCEHYPRTRTWAWMSARKASAVRRLDATERRLKWWRCCLEASTVSRSDLPESCTGRGKPCGRLGWDLCGVVCSTRKINKISSCIPL